MKYNLRDELDLLIGLRKGETQEESVDFKLTDKSKVHKLAQETLKKLYRLKLPTLEPPKEYSPGQVWQTKTCDERFPSGPFGPKSFILTTVEKEAEVYEILGVPISEEWRFATPSDLVIGPGGGMPHIYDEWVMIELGMETFIPREAISRYMGEVSDELFAQIQSILSWLDGEEVEREFLDAEKATAENGANLGPPMERWVLTDPVTGQKHKVLMGQQIVGKDDPRLVYKRLATEDLYYIILPVVKREKEAWEESIERQSTADIKDLTALLGKVLEKLEKLENLMLNHINVEKQEDVEKTYNQGLSEREPRALEDRRRSLKITYH